MRLTTIWTLRGMKLRDRFKQTYDLLAMKTANRLPNRVKYWAFVLVGTRAMNGNDIVPQVRFMELMERAEGAPK
jgi:hypothetical protein